MSFIPVSNNKYGVNYIKSHRNKSDDRFPPSGPIYTPMVALSGKTLIFSVYWIAEIFISENLNVFRT